jgi:hypothetical protein
MLVHTTTWVTISAGANVDVAQTRCGIWKLNDGAAEVIRSWLAQGR